MGVNGIDPLGLTMGYGIGFSNPGYTKTQQEGYKATLEGNAQVVDGIVEKPLAAIDTYCGTNLTDYDDNLVKSLTAYESSYLLQNENTGWSYYLYGSCYMFGIHKIPTSIDRETLTLGEDGLPTVIRHSFWESQAIGAGGWLESVGTYYRARGAAAWFDSRVKAGISKLKGKVYGPNPKPDLPDPQAQNRYSWPGHRNAVLAEEELARIIHDLPDEVVIRWGDKIGTHGSDVISVNVKTGQVTLWDAKFRSNAVRIQPSPTFTPGSKPMNNALNEAITTLEANMSLPPNIKQQALDNLYNNIYRTRTVGMGNAKNSTLR